MSSYDIIIFGGGIGGLFAAARLQRAGYNLLLIEKDRLGGVQTLASQGMIHGGQKYALGGGGGHAASIAAMPARWDACFEGRGELDLSAVKFLSASQVMFPAGGFLSSFAVFAAARAVRGKTRKLGRAEVPEALKRGPVYGMQEKVLDTKSLIDALAQNLEGRIFRGEAQEIAPEGRVVVSGIPLQAKVIIFAAGAGNEAALGLLGVKERQTQRRPLRQVMVRTMEQALYGHGIIGSPKPRVTVTSHPLAGGGYVWYLGGDVAERGVKLSEPDALRFAKKEMQEIFPHIDWAQKEWASLLIDRAEPFDAGGQLPSGPYIRQQGSVMIAWPVKLTFAPALADQVFALLHERGIGLSPAAAPPSLPPEAGIGSYPWEEAQWRRI